MITLATWPDIERVARNMCARHRQNACCLSFSDDPVLAISHLAAQNYIAATFWRDGEPVAVGGAVITHPGAASSFLYGTDHWQKNILEITRFFTQNIVSSLRAAGVRRLSVFAPAADPEGERWKRLMGCDLEATLKGYGKGGQDFSLFTRFLSP